MKKVLFIVMVSLLIVSCGHNHHKKNDLQFAAETYGTYNDFVTGQLNVLKRPIILVGKTIGSESIVVQDGNGKLHSYFKCPIVQSIGDTYIKSDTIVK